MKRMFVKSKIHRATVTDANLNYPGSITLDPVLMQAAGIMPYEFVHINNVANGVHWETYAIPGNSGEVILNGPPAHHFKAGDLVVILCLAILSPHEIKDFEQVVVYVDGTNKIRDTTSTSPFSLALS